MTWTHHDETAAPTHLDDQQVMDQRLDLVQRHQQVHHKLVGVCARVVVRLQSQADVHTRTRAHTTQQVAQQGCKVANRTMPASSSQGSEQLHPIGLRDRLPLLTTTGGQGGQADLTPEPLSPTRHCPHLKVELAECVMLCLPLDAAHLQGNGDTRSRARVHITVRLRLRWAD